MHSLDNQRVRQNKSWNCQTAEVCPELKRTLARWMWRFDLGRPPQSSHLVRNRPGQTSARSQNSKDLVWNTSFAGLNDRWRPLKLRQANYYWCSEWRKKQPDGKTRRSQQDLRKNRPRLESWKEKDGRSRTPLTTPTCVEVYVLLAWVIDQNSKAIGSERIFPLLPFRWTLSPNIEDLFVHFRENRNVQAEHLDKVLVLKYVQASENQIANNKLNRTYVLKKAQAANVFPVESKVSRSVRVQWQLV